MLIIRNYGTTISGVLLLRWNTQLLENRLQNTELTSLIRLTQNEILTKIFSSYFDIRFAHLVLLPSEFDSKFRFIHIRITRCDRTQHSTMKRTSFETLFHTSTTQAQPPSSFRFSSIHSLSTRAFFPCIFSTFDFPKKKSKKKIPLYVACAFLPCRCRNK